MVISGVLIWDLHIRKMPTTVSCSVKISTFPQHCRHNFPGQAGVCCVEQRQSQNTWRSPPLARSSVACSCASLRTPLRHKHPLVVGLRRCATPDLRLVPH